MWCSSNKEDLKSYFIKSIDGGWMEDSIKSITELDRLIKGYLKDKKQYIWWTSRKLIENPKNNKESWYNCFWKCENSENSLYLKGMNDHKWQIEVLIEAMREVYSKNLDSKEYNRLCKKIETRINRMNK